MNLSSSDSVKSDVKRGFRCRSLLVRKSLEFAKTELAFILYNDTQFG